jgi:hypothetical protein
MVVVIVNLQRVSVLEAEDHAKVLVHAPSAAQQARERSRAGAVREHRLLEGA